MTTENMALSWDSEIGDGEQKPRYVLLSAGEYEFTIIDLQKGMHMGNGKIKECPKATVTLEIVTPEGRAEIKENLLLHTSMEWKLASFFRSLGLKKSGEKLKMQFDKVPGARGRAQIKVEKWTDRDGNERESNRVDYFVDFDVTKMTGPCATEVEFDQTLPWE